MDNIVYGARATVLINYEGDIASLANILSQALQISDFSISNNEYPPHNLIGMCEGFGWECWLEKNNTQDGFQYVFKMETLDSFDEIANNRMHDLSPWLARLIGLMCELETST